MAAATEPTPPTQGLRAIDPAPFRLRLEGRDEALAALGRTAAESAGLAAVLADLDRAIQPFGPGFGAPWAARRAKGLKGGFRWDAEDSTTELWYPQGVTASEDGAVVLVSWYQKGSNVARLSCVDPAAGRYRHLRLATAALEPVHTHAGGLALREDMLYVADTNAGLRVFDLSRVLRTPAAGDDRYALPQIGRYRPAGAALRCSFTSVDEAANGLLVGEYLDKTPGARLVRWTFAPGGLLVEEAASEAWVTGHTNLQGALALPERMLMAQSRGTMRAGILHASPYAEAAEQRRWAVGGEDLAEAGGEILTLTEHPDLPRPLPQRRVVFRAGR